MAEEVKLEQKPLSSNVVAAFFQRIYRWWIGVWYGFAQKHPKLSSWIYKIGFFLIFSYGVTIWQYIVMTFLPYLIGYDPNNYSTWGWAPFQIMGEDCTILGDAKGLSYFIAYEIAVFTAQCINFPLQRNITYRSHGNPWFQAMWYFIGWVIISLVMNLIWGVVNCFMMAWGWPDAVIGLVKTFITGGVSMVIFFFIFMIIFPNVDKDEQTKVAKAEKAKAKYDENPSDEGAKAAYEKAQLTATKATETRKVYYAEGAISKASSFAETKIVAYLAIKKKFESGKVSEADLNKAKEEATAAVIERDKIVPEQNVILEEVKAARAQREAK